MHRSKGQLVLALFPGGGTYLGLNFSSWPLLPIPSILCPAQSWTPQRWLRQGQVSLLPSMPRQPGPKDQLRLVTDKFALAITYRRLFNRWTLSTPTPPMPSPTLPQSRLWHLPVRVSLPQSNSTWANALSYIVDWMPLRSPNYYLLPDQCWT